MGRLENMAEKSHFVQVCKTASRQRRLLEVSKVRCYVLIRRNTVAAEEHPGRPSGFEPGRFDIFAQALLVTRKFISRAEEPLELVLTEPVPELIEFRPADWPEKIYLWPINVEFQPDNSVALVVFFIDRPVWPERREDSLGEFQEKQFKNRKL